MQITESKSTELDESFHEEDIIKMTDTVDDVMAWSIIPPVLDYENHHHNIDERREILPLGSSDSMPSQYGKVQESKNNGIIMPPIQNHETILQHDECVDMNPESNMTEVISVETCSIGCQTITNSDGQQKGQVNHMKDSQTVYIKSIKDSIMEHDTVKHFITLCRNYALDLCNPDHIHDAMGLFRKSKVLILWFITTMVVFYLAKLANEQSQHIHELHKEIDLLKKTLSDVERMKQNHKSSDNPRWFSHGIAQGSIYVKEWASSLVDFDSNFQPFSSDTDDATFLDILPNQAFSTVKGLSSTMSQIFGNVLDEVSTITKDVINVVGEGISAASEHVITIRPDAYTNSTLSKIVLGQVSWVYPLFLIILFEHFWKGASE